MKKFAAVISDVHGKMSQYIQLTQQYNKTVQLGDMGFNYEKLSQVDPAHHRFFKGNHDNYDEGQGKPYDLGDYGYLSAPFPFFYIRGANSIDQSRRTIGIDWWEEEELSLRQCENCLSQYCQIKPSVVIAHTCPEFLAPCFIGDKPLKLSKTGRLLQECVDNHPPKIFIHGHQHQSFAQERNGTLYVCLEELETFEVDQDGNYDHLGFKGRIKVNI